MIGGCHDPLAKAAMAVATGLVLLLPASGGAGALDTRYRDHGPLVQDDPYLDLAMHFLNARIVEQHEQEALIAQLDTPVVDQQRMTEVANVMLLPSSARPELRDTDFGLAVADDRSLEQSLIAFNLERATTSGDLFLQIAEAASAPGREVDTDSFSLVAAMLHDRWSVEELRQEVERATTGFGVPVTDGPTLQGSLAALNDRIQELEAQALVLTAQGAPPVTGTSFVTFALAVSSD
jgi:hypothetical protein